LGKVVEKVRLVNSFDPEKSIEVEAVIDTGATMMVLPKNLVETLGLKKVEDAKVKWGRRREV
jgi:predicted aspartyl protease